MEPEIEVAALDVAVLDEIETELADVEHALQRLEDGTYATCERCSGVIDAARLEQFPVARWCAACD
jgi:RNA polymerase-binding transcription factor DksA